MLKETIKFTLGKQPLIKEKIIILEEADGGKAVIFPMYREKADYAHAEVAAIGEVLELTGKWGTDKKTNAPQFYVDSGKLRLIFPAIWADNSVSKPSIRFNATWAKYLIGFPLWRSDKFGFTPGGQDARIRIEDEAFTIKLPDRTGLPIAFGSTVYGVGGDLAYIEEMFPKPGTLAAVRGITLTTTSIPVNSEILPNAVSIGSQGVSNASSSIISDYLMDTDSYTEQHKIVYLPQAEYRISQLNGHDALRRITIQAWWSDQFGVRYPLMLPINGTFAVKLMFKRRTE